MAVLRTIIMVAIVMITAIALEHISAPQYTSFRFNNVSSTKPHTSFADIPPYINCYIREGQVPAFHQNEMGVIPLQQLWTQNFHGYGNLTYCDELVKPRNTYFYSAVMPVALFMYLALAVVMAAVYIVMYVLRALRVDWMRIEWPQ